MMLNKVGVYIRDHLDCSLFKSPMTTDLHEDLGTANDAALVAHIERALQKQSISLDLTACTLKRVPLSSYNHQ